VVESQYSALLLVTPFENGMGDSEDAQEEREFRQFFQWRRNALHVRASDQWAKQVAKGEIVEQLAPQRADLDDRDAPELARDMKQGTGRRYGG